MGILKSVCVSTKAKSSAKNVHQATVVATGISGDIHCCMGDKQISILPFETVKACLESKGEPVVYGRFGENLDVEGVDWSTAKVGDRIYCEDVILQITAIGSKWEGMEDFKGERVCTPMEKYFIFCRVLSGGILTEGDSISLT